MALVAPTPQSSAERLLAELARTTPAMRATWVLTLLLCAGVPLLAPLAGVTIAWNEFWTLPALAAAVGVVGVLLRTHGRWLRIADVAEVAGALGLLAVFVPLLTCMLARTGAPLADQRLIAWDAALGLDWLRLATLLKDQQSLTLALCHAYASLMQQPTVLLAVLGLAGLTHRLQQFALAWAVALVGTVLVFPFLPAVGGYLHHGLTPNDFPFIRVPAPFMYGKVLLAARDGSMSELGVLALEGIVAFPSFHTAAAVLLAWGFWGVRLVRWPALALNVAMIASCPFIGAHYIVDLIAGAALAWGAIRIAQLFGAPDSRYLEDRRHSRFSGI
jgi:membrane-associated phospholipid phosphatase